jgi:hypothetical protein
VESKKEIEQYISDLSNREDNWYKYSINKLKIYVRGLIQIVGSFELDFLQWKVLMAGLLILFTGSFILFYGLNSGQIENKVWNTDGPTRKEEDIAQNKEQDEEMRDDFTQDEDSNRELLAESLDSTLDSVNEELMIMDAVTQELEQLEKGLVDLEY